MMKIVTLILFLLIQVSLVAQNESGERSFSMDQKKATLQYANDTTMIYHKKYPIIQDIPPLNTSMPYEIMQSYIYLDSAARHLTESQFDAELDALNQINDTLANLMKYYYKIVDYNPIIFRQYASETQIDQQQRYSLPVRDIEIKSLKKYRNLLPDSIKYALFSMLNAEYILRVKVVEIDSMKSPHPMYGGDTTKYRFYNAKCIVQDTIKGQVFNSEQLTEQVINKQNKTLNNSTMSFSYSYLSYPQRFWGMSHNKSTETWYPKVDTNLSNEKMEFMPEVGQEMIVFLFHLTKLYDEHNDYFRLSVDYYSSNCALSIENDMVYDVNKVWSDSETMTYAEWLQRYDELKTMIIEE